MQTIRISTFLRWTLLADAATCLAMGVLMTLGSERLGDRLALPTSLLFYSGLSLYPFAGLLLYLATRRKTAAALVWALVIANALWAFDSLAILLAGWVTPNGLGQSFIVLQVLGVAVLTALEVIGLKRSATELNAAIQN
ncbi:MAG TPA: hypothetical protein VJ302_15500 [Blastocatellia bacterium]|nr:hypothetical protein [Blastocatellia bacterium]